MRVVAVVPIKLENERLPGKNTRMLGGVPLIQYILRSLSQVPRIDRTIVYCSNPDIRHYMIGSAEFARRSKCLDLPTSNFTQIFTAFSAEFPAEIYVYAHATAPFVSPQTINLCLDKVMEEGYDSAFTAQKIQDFLWMNGRPLNFTATNIPRSQDLPLVFRETSGVYVFTRRLFQEKRARVGDRPFIAEVGLKEAVDINYLEDFILAEKLLCD